MTIKLKPYAWSNGEKVTSADVLFWINLERAEKANYAGYVPGQFPDNVTSATAPDSSTVVLTLNAAYSQQWFTSNQLGQITPMPMAWDVTAAGTPGTCASSVSGCAAVYKYMLTQTKDLPTYATNPLWQVVDGPWKLSSFNAEGHVTFVPNGAYSGTPRPTLKKLVLAPFTTDSAEFNVLRTGQTLDVGYLPTQDVTQAKSAGSGPATAGPNPLSSKYALAPLFLYGFNFFPLNFNNPTSAKSSSSCTSGRRCSPLVNQLDHHGGCQGLRHADLRTDPDLPGQPAGLRAGEAEPVPVRPRRGQELPDRTRLERRRGWHHDLHLARHRPEQLRRGDRRRPEARLHPAVRQRTPSGWPSRCRR